MTIESEIFKKSTVDFNKLIPFGFILNKNNYCFEKIFMSGKFKAKIKIDKSGNVTGEVFDIENEEIYYPLRIENFDGAYVNLVRTGYKKILNNIKKSCFNKNSFIFPQSNRIAKHILNNYGDYPQFLWKKFPGYGVFKNASNKKWYGIISNIDYSKINKTKTGEIEVINLKLDEKIIIKLLKEKGFYPAWHMNKQTWITLILNETLTDDTVMKYVEQSYKYTIGEQKEWIVPANPKYFDIEAAFNKNSEIIWKQSSNILKGDIAYMYVAAPYSSILYKCEVTAVNIPYDYKDNNIKINKVMKIKLLKKYNKNFMTFTELNKYGITAVRGPRVCPEKLSKILK
jgi:predicted DNA-binding protein (MmcQ/YjbR family)